MELAGFFIGAALYFGLSEIADAIKSRPSNVKIDTTGFRVRVVMEEGEHPCQ